MRDIPNVLELSKGGVFLLFTVLDKMGAPHIFKSYKFVFTKP